MDRGFQEWVTRGREEATGGEKKSTWEEKCDGGGGGGHRNTPESLQTFKGKSSALTDRPLE